jgi:fructokinase
MKPSALVFGEILWDIIEGNAYLGGAPLNFAAHFAKCGGASSIFSSIGSDPLGNMALAAIEKTGVDTSLIQQHPNFPTGTVDVFLDQQGQPDYDIKENVAYDNIAPPGKSEKFMYDIFYFGSLAQRNSVSKQSLWEILSSQNFQYRFYDINLRKEFYSYEVIHYSLMHCNVFKINDDEVRQVSILFYKKEISIEDFSKRLSDDYKIDVVIVTAGDKGCHIWENGLITHVPAVPVHVVDTVGAGDAFSAAFMHTYFISKDAVKAAAMANLVGSYVAGSKGPIPDYTSELQRKLALEL